MHAQRIFNALNAGLAISSKYTGLFFEDIKRDTTVITYYYNSDGKVHNDDGPAIVTRVDGLVTCQKFVSRGDDITDTIEDLKEQGAISGGLSSDGEYIFSDADKFTIGLSL